jgi:hypothetical protein
MEAVEETVLLRAEQSGPPVGWSISQSLIALSARVKPSQLHLATPNL